MQYKEVLKVERESRDKIRRDNLQKLVARFGSQKALAIAISRSPAQIGNIIRGVAPFGDNLKDHIESSLNLDNGYLDRVGPGFSNVHPLSSSERKTTHIPLLSVVQAGSPTDHGDCCFDEYIDVPGDFPSGCYALKVSGDSMSPLMDDGDVVIVDPNRWPRPGEYIVARSELENLNEATVKRYYPVGFDESGREIFEARPLNTFFPVMHSVHQKLRIIGTVCKLLKDL